jgi:hypothetical protein
MRRENGWGTWIRTKIDGVRVRCSTVELSPKDRPGAEIFYSSRAVLAGEARSLEKRWVV